MSNTTEAPTRILHNNDKVWYSFEIKLPVPDTTDIKSYSFKVKKPTRSEREMGEWIRSKYITKYIEDGLLPEAVLRKKLEDAGGTVSKNQSQEYLEYQLTLMNLEREYQLLKTEGKEEEAKLKYNEWNEVQRNIIALETEYGSTYENSAESKGRNKLIQFFTYHLIYWLPENGKEYVQYFSGEDFESKMRYAYALDDAEDPLYQKVEVLGQLFVSALLYSKGKISHETLGKLPNDMGIEG